MHLVGSQNLASKHVNDDADDDVPEIDGPRSLVLLVRCTACLGASGVP